MKHLLITLALSAVGTLAMQAVPAYPWPVTVTGPDGQPVTVQVHGDEYCSWITNAQGQMVEYDAQGRLTVVTDAPIALNALNALNAPNNHRAPKRRLADYKRFRGLVILVNFNDRTIGPAKSFYEAECNQEGYTGFYSGGTKVACTGSVRDYFRDNSMGLFNPEFDVAGPVTIDYSCRYPEKTLHGTELAEAALRAADAEVDYSKYDSDGDGVVDMVFFIYAGYGSNYANDQHYIWPHQANLPSGKVVLDGVKLGTYACSTEMQGVEGRASTDGIGTICHEFSHVLGLMDEYDTDYEKSGGTSNHPGDWSVMAQGCYLNGGRTPVGYSLYQRVLMGFASPADLQEGSYTLRPLDLSNEGYILPTPVQDEFFTIEYRLKNQKWDQYLPGSGMLIHRVDRSNLSVWERNIVNQDPSRNYYELVRAGAGTNGDSPADAFPGTRHVTAINNTTTPSLRTWSGRYNPLGLEDIAENSDGTLTFRATLQPTLEVEDFTGGELSDAGVYHGNIADWTFSGRSALEVTTCGNGIEGQAVALCKNGVIQSSPLTQKVGTLNFNSYNPASEAKLLVQYTLDGGNTWQYVPDDRGVAAAITLAAGAAARHSLDLSAVAQDNQTMSLRWKLYTGSTTQPLYIDNIGMALTPKPGSGIDDITVEDGTTTEVYYNLQGQPVSHPTPGQIVLRHGQAVRW